MIEIKNISKQYGKSVLANDNITFNIEDGRILGVLGPNGAGKTTLIKQICGLLKPNNGKILIDKKDIRLNKEVITEYIAYQGQQLYVLDSHTIREAIYYTGIYRGLTKEEAKLQTTKLLEYFNMIPDEKKLMSKVSGGQKRLVSVISALIGLKPIIVLDEPTNDLDPVNRSKLWKLIKQISNNNNIIIIVSHNITELEDVVDDIVIINSGKLLKHGALYKLKMDMSDDLKYIIKCKEEKTSIVEEKIKEYCNRYSITYSIQNKTDITIIVKKNLLQAFVIEILNLIDIENIVEIKMYRVNLEDIYLSTNN